MIIPVGYSSTLRVFGIEAGPPVGGGRKYRRPPLHHTPTSSTLALQMSSAEAATFGRKRDFWQISTPSPENSGAPCTSATKRRKLLRRVGKQASKISAARITAFELLAVRIHKKLKIPNFRQSPLTYAWQGRGAKMRYMPCLFDSTGPIFNLKFFPLYGVGLRTSPNMCARSVRSGMFESH